MKRTNIICICGLAIILAACEKDTDAMYFAPTVTTGNATDIYRKGATLSGSIELAETSTAESYGILFSKLKSMAESTEYPISSEETEYEVNVQNLEPGTTYYYCAYANSGFSISRGEVKNFTTTENNPPVFGDLSIDSIAPDRVFISAEILDDGSAELVLSGICWKEGSEGIATFIDNVVNVTEVQDNKFSAVITGLKPETDYILAAYSVNTNGMGFSESIVVKTGETEVPVLSLITPKDSTDFSITVSAKVLASGFAKLERVGFVWSDTEQEPVLPTNAGSSITGLGYCSLYDQLEIEEFSTTIENLAPSTTYYIRAYAVNETGEGYSDVISFTTGVAEVAYLGAGSVVNGELKRLVNGNNMTCWDIDSLVCKIAFVTECKIKPEEFIKLSSVNSAPVYASFDKTDSLLTVFTSAKRLEIVDAGHLFSRFKALRQLDLGGFTVNETTTNLNDIFYYCPSLSSLDVSDWNTSNVVDMSSMFEGCFSLTTLDVSNWDTSNVTTMAQMFSECSSLTSLDVSNWNTSSVTNMAHMFDTWSNWARDGSSLTSLDVSNWDTSNVTTMRYMFGYNPLTYLDVSNWDVSNVTDMCGMFACIDVTTLDVSKWDTSSVTDMEYMFGGCISLASLDVSNWNTSKVTTMHDMFCICGSLTTLDVSSWDTSSVVDMAYMFEGCSSLTSLELSNWNTSNVTEMKGLVVNCSSLTYLNASNWNTSNVTDMEDMFEACYQLEKLNLSNWSLKDDVILTNMFNGCASTSQACEITSTTATKDFLLGKVGTTSMDTNYFTWKEIQ